MIDVSGIEYDFLPSVLWTIGFIVVGVALAWVGIANFDEWWASLVGPIGIVLTLLGVIGGPLVIIGQQAGEAVSSEETRLATEQLKEQGYDRLSLDWENKTFTSSVEGEFFEGILHPQGNYTYQVLEVGEVAP
jgi:hypothetical protein